MVFSLEMPTSTVMARICSYLKQIPLAHILRSQLATKEELITIKEWTQKMETHDGLRVCDSGFITIDEIVTRTLEEHEKEPLGMIVIDYCQLIAPSKGATSRSREQEVAESSRKLKALAKDTGTVVLALSQINKEGGLRESQAQENDADIILKISPESGIAVVKYRSAKRGQMLPIFLDGQMQTFRQASF
jgi:replicative DNA helicase